MDYSTFSENQSLYFANVILSIFVTLLAYGAGPLLFVVFRRKPILKKRFRLFCIFYTLIVSISFMALRSMSGDNVGTFAPALIWGFVFYRIGSRILRSKGAILTEENTQKEAGCAVAKQEPTPIVEVYRSNFKLPQDREKQAGRNYFKTGFFILLAVFVCTSAVFAWQYSTCVTEVKEAQKEAVSLKERVRSGQTAINELRDQISKLEDAAQDAEEESDMLNNSIGFIVDGSSYYHNYWCNIFRRAPEYWAHNIEYCEYIGYSPCPYCW